MRGCCWLTKVLENQITDYEFNPTEQLNHINMGHNCAKLHSNKVGAITNNITVTRKDIYFGIIFIYTLIRGSF